MVDGMMVMGTLVVTVTSVPENNSVDEN